MEPIVYPSREQLEIWVEYLKGTNNILEMALPISDEDWYTKVIATVERVQIPYIEGLKSKAAHLFYYVVKGHNFPDGNKRTGIAITYLFFLVNGYEIKSAERIRVLAKKVARSHGSRNKEYWLKKIAQEFSYVCTPANNS